MPSPLDDLARTRINFETWRSSQPGRRRIPEHLWHAAVALLNHFPLSRVAHELRLSPKQLRQHRLSAGRPLVSEASNGLHFVEMCATGLSNGACASKTDSNSHHYSTETGLRMIFERPDGCRLTLCLPASEWDHITTLCTAFIRL